MSSRTFRSAHGGGVYSFVDYDPTNSALVTGSVVETTVYTKVFPAGFFSTESGLRIRGWLSGGGSSGSYQELKIKLNGSTAVTHICQTATPATAVETSTLFDSILLNDSSLVSQKSVTIGFNADANGNTIQGLETFSGQSVSNIGRSTGLKVTKDTSAIDTSGSVTLTITVTNSIANGDTKFMFQGVTIEKIGS